MPKWQGEPAKTGAQGTWDENPVTYAPNDTPRRAVCMLKTKRAAGRI
jgi:hypothetical protein